MSTNTKTAILCKIDKLFDYTKKFFFIRIWNTYRDYVRSKVLPDTGNNLKNISHWQNEIFYNILLYFTPISVIALIPGVYMSLIAGLPFIALADLLAFFLLITILVRKRLSLFARKFIFVSIFYFSSIVLLYYLGIAGPALIYFLTLSVLSSIIFQAPAGYYSAWVNTFICIIFGVLIFSGIQIQVVAEYTLGSWLAVTSNLVLLSFISAKSLYLLLGGLEISLNNHSKSEEKLIKANRLYYFISQINQSIVHTKNEGSLFRSSCQIAFEIGKFKMAWIGKIDSGCNKIALIDQNGISEKDLPLFNTTYESSGPQDSVVRTGTYYVCNDIENNLELRGWKSFAMAHGIQSCITLPIKKEGEIIATFNLYAAELNFFDKQEIRLLEEATGDISFALDIFEKERRHNEAEQLVVKNERRFRAMVEDGSDGVALISQQGTLLYVSPSIEKILGYTEEEAMTLNIFSSVHQDDIDGYTAVWENVLANPGTPIKGYTSRLMHKNGTWRWLEASVTNMLHDPSVNGIVDNFRDITEKIKMQEQQEFDRNNLTALINNTADLMWSVDRNFNLITSNQPFEEMCFLNFGKRILRGGNVLNSAYTPEMLDHFKGLYERAFEGEIFTETEYFAFPSELWTEISYYPIRKGEEVIGTACHSRDITNIKKSELQLHNSEVFNRGILNSLSSHIAVIDAIGNIVAVNESWKRFALKNGGTGLQTLGVGSNYYAVCKKSLESGNQTAGIALQGILDVMNETRTDFYLEYPCHSPDKQRWFGMRVLKFDNDESNVVISHINLSERKLSEKNLQESEAHLAEAQRLAKMGSWNFDMETKVLTWSAELYNVFDTDRQTFKETHGSFLHLLDEEDRETALKTSRHTQQTGEPFTIEYHITTAKGEKRIIQEHGYGQKDDHGNVVRLFGTAQDITARKQAEEKLIITSNSLQHALNDLNKIMNSSLDVICAIDAKSCFVKVSAACKTIWGYTVDEMIGKSLFDFVYQEDHEKTRRSAEEVMTGTNVSNFENRYVCKDGSIVPMSWSVRWDANDRIRYGIARDMTEKKRLEKGFEIERQQFYDLFSEAPSSMGILSGPDHRYEMANPLYLQLIGRSDIIGKRVRDVLPEVVGQGFIDILDAVYQTGKTFSANEMLIKLDKNKNGVLVDSYLSFTYHAHKTTEGIIDGILFFAIDLSEQVLSRKKIEESEARLKEAQSLLHISNWEIDVLKDKHHWSDEVYNLFGIGDYEVDPSQKSFLSFIHHHDAGYVSDVMAKAYETDGPSHFHARIITRSGLLKYIYSEWKIERDENLNPIRMYGILQDVTEIKLAEIERSRITGDLIQRNRDLEQFAFIISHNLRAPTANIIGLTQILQDDALRSEDKKEILHGLSMSVTGLDTVIKDLNVILQIKSEINEKKEVIKFSKLVNDILLSIDDLVIKHHVLITTDFSEVDEIYSLKGYMYSIFFNLISNSIKYRMPHEPPHIKITSRKKNGEIILTFEDNGLGIDMKTKGDKVFGLYKRFHSHVEGKGMGLFMVKTQVESIGGKITIASTLNKGTIFTIEF